MYVIFCQPEVIYLIHLDLDPSTILPDNNRRIQVTILILFKGTKVLLYS